MRKIMWKRKKKRVITEKKHFIPKDKLEWYYVLYDHQVRENDYSSSLTLCKFLNECLSDIDMETAFYTIKNKPVLSPSVVESIITWE